VVFLAPVATSPMVVAAMLALALWLATGQFLRLRLGAPWMWPVLLMVGLTWAGLSWSADVATGLEFAKRTYYWLFAFVVASLTLREKEVGFVLRAFVAGTTFTSAMFVLQVAGLVPMRPPYSVGLLGKWAHIPFSLLLCFCLLLLSFYFKKEPGRRALYGLLLAVNFLALALLKTDSGHLAFLLLSPLVASNLVGHGKALRVLGVSVLLVAALFASPVTQERLRQTLYGTALYVEGSRTITGLANRYYMWTGAWRIYKEHPLRGVGTGAYQDHMKEYRLKGLLPDRDVQEDPVQPHSSLLYMLVSFGPLGVVALLWLYAVLLKEGWQRRHALAGYAVLCYTLVMLIGGLTDSQLLELRTGILFAVVTGLSIQGDDRTAS